MTDAYTFSWREFQGNLKATFKEFRKSSEFSDVTLVCGDGVQVEGHKMILASGSDFFRTLLRGHTHQAHPLIYLRGVQSRCFLAIVDYIYRGEATVPQGDLEEFLANAEEFGLQGLKQVAAGEMDKFEGAENETQDGHENMEELAKPDDGEVSRMENENCEIPITESFITASVTSTMSYGCNQCEFFTETNAALKEHEQNLHSEINPEDCKDAIQDERCKLEEKLPFFCNYCDFESKELYHFNLHKQKGHNRSSKRRLPRHSLNSKLTCVKCDFTTRRKSELKVHTVQKHNKGTIFECNLCDFKTLRSIYLEGHKETKHEGIKYDCNACEYQATQRGNLNRHKLMYHPAGIKS